VQTTSLETRVRRFAERVRTIKHYERALALLSWDAQTMLPRKGVEARAQVIGTLTEHQLRLLLDPQLAEDVEALTEPEAAARLEEPTREAVRLVKREIERRRAVPLEVQRAFAELTTEAEAVWAEARKENDFARFSPYLERIVAMVRTFADCWGYDGHPYNALLDDYEPGMTVDKLDALFGELCPPLQALLDCVRGAGPVDAAFLRRTFPVDRQRAFVERVLADMGFDFDGGRLDVSAHPFCTGIHPGDVRITTRYNPNDFVDAFFSALHEGGHALYEQHLPTEWADTPLAEGASMGIHESQSRFWDTFIGLSRPFWERYYPEAASRFPEAFGDVSLMAFYRAINRIEPSLIRVDADPLTYQFHILLRYELEKQLLVGELAVTDLPAAWRSRMRAYLGIEPQTDADGVLQDVHWSAGLFGYFPTYTLGNLYAAQLYDAMRRELGDVDERVARGEFASIRAWLADRVHRHGRRYLPETLIQKATGEPPTAQPFIAFLEEKVRDVYGV